MNPQRNKRICSHCRRDAGMDWGCRHPFWHFDLERLLWWR